MWPEDQIKEMKDLFGEGITAYQESGLGYLMIPKLKLPDGCSPSECNALLCPAGRDGYPSRLYFEQRIATKGSPNWTQARILERQWEAVSWKIEPNIRLAQMVGAHLRALR